MAQEPPDGNQRNGHGRKRVKTAYGEVDISTPRDRESTFEPVLLPKRERILNAELDLKIIKLYGLGVSVRDISEHIRDLYGVEVSEGTISRITTKCSMICVLGNNAPWNGPTPWCGWTRST